VSDELLKYSNSVLDEYAEGLRAAKARIRELEAKLKEQPKETPGQAWTLTKQEFGEFLLVKPDGNEIGLIWNKDDADQILSILNPAKTKGKEV
jgi:hypothetical protein